MSFKSVHEKPFNYVKAIVSNWTIGLTFATWKTVQSFSFHNSVQFTEYFISQKAHSTALSNLPFLSRIWLMLDDKPSQSCHNDVPLPTKNTKFFMALLSARSLLITVIIQQNWRCILLPCLKILGLDFHLVMVIL